ncbi:type II secretion system protein [Psychrobacillus sp. NPDC096623]|uniref:type II secretion system protein n=1 Tax=Psychrobacillus sp. NPDC096623 TaxID=3364492 RepID=UPI00380E2D4F
MKKLTKIIKNQKGLTLIELLAVIVILAIVAAIAVPAVGNIIENSKFNAAKADASNVLNAAQLYLTENPNGPSGDTGTTVTVQNLIDNKFLESAGKVPVTATITKAKPHKLTATFEYTSGKNAIFTGASLEGIAKDVQKGSDANHKTINN